MKIIHTSDIHFYAGAKDLALASLDTVIETGGNEGVDLFVIAGDLFDRGVQNSASGGLPALIDRVRRMLDIAPVVTVYGTKTHDVPGCYDVFWEINAARPFTVLDPGKAYSGIVDGLLILGCPEPTKEWSLAGGNGTGIQETNEAIKQGMRDLFLGLGATRKEYSDIPCLFVYHGSVAGATLQNSQLLPPGGIEVGRDDLALVGADYYALGHIHLAQQIGDLPAYYAGSAYPVNWGETDQKSFNLVPFETAGGYHEAYVEHVPYPHPPRKKLTVHPDYGYNYREVAGFQVWLDVRGTKEELSGYDADIILEALLENGALSGSRVTTTVIPTETTRAAEIQDAEHLRDKLKVWAENSEKAVANSVLEKADSIETEARREGLTTDGLHIRIKKLRLRGATGIMKGQGKEEIELDLDAYDPGLIALVGKNGAGKSTLIENMHPYNQLLTRSGKLQDHFGLRDSFRDLYFEDTRTGDQYRAYMMIDGQNASGKVECFLTRNGEPLSDGKVTSYQAKIDELFGSLSMFVQSAFVAQKQKYDVTSATTGEKKAIFRELSGLDYLQTYAEIVKQKYKELDNEVAKYEGQRETLYNLIQQKPELEEKAEELESSVRDLDIHLGNAERTGLELKEKVEALQEQVRKNTEVRTRIETNRTKLADHERDRNQLTTSIEMFRLALEKKEKAEQEVQEYEGLKSVESEQLSKQSEVYRERERLQSEHRDRVEALRHESTTRLDEKAELDKEIAAKDQRKAVLQNQIDTLIEKIDEDVRAHCPECGAVLPWEKEKLAQKETLKLTLEEKQQEHADLSVEVNQAEKRVKELAAEIADYTRQLTELREPDLPELDTSFLGQIKDDLSAINIEAARKTLATANEAEGRVEEIETRIAVVDRLIVETSTAIREQESRYDVFVDVDYEIAAEELEKARADYQQRHSERATKEAERQHVLQQLETIAKQEEDLHDMQRKEEHLKHEIADWMLLQQACGPDGIQALELDALAPNITEVANRLLTAAYGAQFLIEIRTTRVAGKGSKTKQVEDFQLYVLDNQGNAQSIDTLSGGESVWIKKALYDAFGIIRARNTGTKFLTVFQDEADGALDPKAREKYFRMLEAAHAESGRHHTLVITHSPEIQEMIAQRIEMSSLSVMEPAAV